MRWIFRYNEVAAKYLGKLTKTKMKVEPQPWLHVAVKTMSERNPWSGYVIYIWDTRQIVGEYRSNKGLFRTNMFTKEASGMSRAVDNRQPLVGGRKDVNEFFEFGKFDASHSEIFDADGKRIENTPLYNRRAKKMQGTEALTVGDMAVIYATNDGKAERLRRGKIDAIQTVAAVLKQRNKMRPENVIEFEQLLADKFIEGNSKAYLIKGIWYTNVNVDGFTQVISNEAQKYA